MTINHMFSGFSCVRFRTYVRFFCASGKVLCRVLCFFVMACVILAFVLGGRLFSFIVCLSLKRKSF